MRLYLKKHHHKKRTGAVAQGVDPEFKPQYYNKKKKKERKKKEKRERTKLSKTVPVVCRVVLLSLSVQSCHLNY
jgi:glutamine amidotransferase-like uncharacterized protein